MSKFIIKNLTDVSDIDVLTIVQKIISKGRISNNGKQYCYASVYQNYGKEYMMVTDLRKCSDVFTFYEIDKPKENV